MLQCWAKEYTPVAKDPVAIFSADWLAKIFDMNIVALIRHPAAFCSSLKAKDWKLDFSSFLNQPLLMSKYFGRLEADIRGYTTNEKDIISQAILLWNCIHHAIKIYQNAQSNWLFVKHETLSSNPVGEFSVIYKFLGLEFTPEVTSSVLELRLSRPNRAAIRQR